MYWTSILCQTSQAKTLQFKLTMNCSRPVALLTRGMRGLPGVSGASQISQGLVKHSLNWPLGPAQCKVKIQGESWNLASTVHLAEFIYCTGALAARPGQCPREISADGAWPEWIDPGNGQQCHSVLTAPPGAIVTHWSALPGRVTGPGFCLYVYLTNFQTIQRHLRFPWRPPIRVRDPEVKDPWEILSMKTIDNISFYTWKCPLALVQPSSPAVPLSGSGPVLTAAPPSSHLGTIHRAELDNSQGVLTHFIDVS